jgi:hypothetical protein
MSPAISGHRLHRGADNSVAVFGDDDFELPRSVDAFDPPQLDVRCRGGAGDEGEGPALAGDDRFQGRDQIRDIGNDPPRGHDADVQVR